MIKKTIEPSLSQKTSLCAMLMMLMVIGYTMLMFAMRIPMSAKSAVVPIAGIAVYSALRDRKLLKSLVICLVILIFWAAICSKIFDWSYDGMYYHKQAIITLAEGWNPFYESSADAQHLNANANLWLWLNNYPKGIWICSAAIYIITDFLETAKAVNILFIIMLFGAAHSTFTTVFEAKPLRAFIFAAAACLNPVYIVQIFTSYNDLAVGVLIITAALLGMKIYNEKADNCDYALLWCVTAMSCLVKFTAPLLVGLILLAYCIGYVIKLAASKVNFKDMLPRFKKPAIIILSGFILGAALLGYNPYIWHIMRGQNIVYPVLGENSYDIMNTNPPKGFEDKPGFQKYFLSLASETNNNISEGYRVKIPFTVHEKEFDYLSHADTRLGGFGVWFSGICILAIVLAAMTALISWQKMRGEIAILLIAFLILGLFFPEAWWARYASFTFYIPLFLLLYASEHSGFRPAAYAVVLVLAVNSAMNIACVIRDGNNITAGINDMLDDIKSEDKKVEIRINDFPSHLKAFEEAGIPYVVAPDSISDEIIFYEDTKYKFLDEWEK